MDEDLNDDSPIVARPEDMIDRGKVPGKLGVSHAAANRDQHTPVLPMRFISFIHRKVIRIRSNMLKIISNYSATKALSHQDQRIIL